MGIMHGSPLLEKNNVTRCGQGQCGLTSSTNGNAFDYYAVVPVE